MKKFATILGIVALGTSAFAADYTANYGWEDGNTILGQFSDITATNVSSPVYNGNSSLELVDGGASGTPQAYVAWIDGLDAPASITVGFWGIDPVGGASPSGRIWGHYNDNNDINDYAGSAGGNSAYTEDTWTYLSWTWSFTPGTNGTGFVVEARTYSSAGDTAWIDDMDITVTTDSTTGFIQTPGGIVSIPEPASLSLIALALLAIRRR